MTDEQLADIGLLVADAAKEIFIDCNAEHDFCIQCVEGVAVFGGTNRLLWSPAFGFRPDKSYCTKEFLAKFDMRSSQCSFHGDNMREDS